MKYQFVSYLWISLLLTVIIIPLLLYTLKNRSVLGSRYFSITLFLIELWIAAQAMEMMALDLPTKIAWANVQYIPIMMTPVTYLYLSLQITRRDRWLRMRWLLVLLLAVPVAMNILLWSNDLHGLLRQNIYLDNSGSFPTIAKTFGPLFWLFAVYNFSVAISVMVLLGSVLREKTSLYRKQGVFLFVAFLLPVISTFLQATGLNPFRVDITPTVFGFSAVFIFWGIFRYGLFDVVPVARSIIIQEMSTGMIVLDDKGRLLDINPAAKKMLKLTGKQSLGDSVEVGLAGWPDLLSVYREGKEVVCEIMDEEDENGEYHEVSFTKLNNKEQKSLGWLLQIHNITKRKRAENMIRYAAFHDSLTGLPNRKYFQIFFTRELSQARMRGDALTVGYLDIDDFKFINDTYGHDVGDKVLCSVANILKNSLRKSDIIARLGGDEFAIALPHLDNDDKIRVIGDKILRALEETLEIEEMSVQIKASIGFSIFPRDGENLGELLKKADIAMYKVKDQGKNGYCIYKE